MNRVGAERDTCACRLFGDHGTELEGVRSTSAELFGRLDSEDAHLAETAIEVAGRMALLLPFVVHRCDFACDEVAHHLSESFMFFVEHRAEHCSSIFKCTDRGRSATQGSLSKLEHQVMEGERYRRNRGPKLTWMSLGPQPVSRVGSGWCRC